MRVQYVQNHHFFSGLCGKKRPKFHLLLLYRTIHRWSARTLFLGVQERQIRPCRLPHENQKSFPEVRITFLLCWNTDVLASEFDFPNARRAEIDKEQVVLIWRQSDCRVPFFLVQRQQRVGQNHET